MKISNVWLAIHWHKPGNNKTIEERKVTKLCTKNDTEPDYNSI